MIDIIAVCNAKSKLIVIDSCYADNPETHNLNYEMKRSVEESYGKGCSIFASSSIEEQSFPYDDTNQYSAFTKFFCDALLDKHIVSEGYLYFNEVQNLVSIYANAWSKKGADKQTPVFRSNSYGTFTLPINDRKYESDEETVPVYTTNWYRIMNVEDQKKFNGIGYMHLFAVKVIVDDHNYQILDVYLHNLYREIYNYLINIGAVPNSIWIFIANDLIDYEDCRWKYVLKYADKENLKWLDKPSERVNFIAKNITYTENSMYDILKNQRLSYTLPDKELIQYWAMVLDTFVNNIEPLINEYRNYKAKDVGYEAIVESRKKALSQMKDLFYKIDDARFPMPYSKLKKYDDICYELAQEIRGVIISVPVSEEDAMKNEYHIMEDTLKHYYKIFYKWTENNKNLMI